MSTRGLLIAVTVWVFTFLLCLQTMKGWKPFPMSRLVSLSFWIGLGLTASAAAVFSDRWEVYRRRKAKEEIALRQPTAEKPYLVQISFQCKKSTCKIRNFQKLPSATGSVADIYRDLKGVTLACEFCGTKLKRGVTVMASAEPDSEFTLNAIRSDNTPSHYVH